MESVCVMLGLKAERKKDPNTGNMYEDFWGTSLKMLSDMKFLAKLKAMDKDCVDPVIIKKIREK